MILILHVLPGHCHRPRGVPCFNPIHSFRIASQNYFVSRQKSPRQPGSLPTRSRFENSMRKISLPRQRRDCPESVALGAGVVAAAPPRESLRISSSSMLCCHGVPIVFKITTRPGALPRKFHFDYSTPLPPCRFHQSWKQVHLSKQQHHQLTEAPTKRLQSSHTHLHMSFANHPQ